MSRATASPFNSHNSTTVAQCVRSGALVLGFRLYGIQSSSQRGIDSSAAFFVRSGFGLLLHHGLGMIADMADTLKNMEVTEVLTEKIPEILTELPQKVSETLQELPQKVQETLQDLPLVPETLQDLQEKIQEINLEDFDIRPVTPIAASVCVYLFSFLMCLMLHRLVKQWMPACLAPFALDFIKTLVACCYPHAHSQVRKNHGHYGYCVAMVAMAMLTQHFMPEGSPTPLTVWTRFLEGSTSLHQALLRMLVQVLGAMCSEHMVTLVWYLELHPAHTHQLKNKYNGCFTDLNVPAYLGFLVECLGAAADTWICMQVLSHLPFVDSLVKCISGAVMTVAGLGWTGMYVQPAMASSFTLGCDGTSISTHIIIYWGGTFLGTYLGMLLHQYKSLKPPKTSAGTMTDLDQGRLQAAPSVQELPKPQEAATVEDCGTSTEENWGRMPVTMETEEAQAGCRVSGRGPGCCVDEKVGEVPGQTSSTQIGKAEEERTTLRRRVGANLDGKTCPGDVPGLRQPSR